MVRREFFFFDQQKSLEKIPAKKIEKKEFIE
jgi:hypothetical protein